MIETLLLDSTFLEKTMKRALQIAAQALPDDVPIGSVIVDSRTRDIVCETSNSRELANDPTNHAEINAIRQLCNTIGDWRLNEYIIFTTLEPCIMCASVLMQSRIGAVVFGARDPQYGAAGSIYNFFTDPRLNHTATVVGDICALECQKVLDDFFASMRA